MSEFFRDERPPDIPGPTLPDSSTGGSWIFPAPDAGNGSWGDQTDDDTAGNGSWHGGAPWIKLSESGYILSLDNYLLTGTDHCRVYPAVIVWLGSDAGWLYNHGDCVLARLTDARRGLRRTAAVDLADAGGQPGRTVLGWRLRGFPGEFNLQMRWQAGHYPHASIGTMRVALFGVDLGQLTIPFSSWRNVATINIDEEYKITINGIIGKINGNAIYF